MYSLSPEADADLEEIWCYVAADDPAAADRLVDSFVERFTMLADFPDIGRRRDELAPGIRSVPVGAYVIFYRMFEDTVQIVRVLHGARDLERHF